MIKQKLLNRLSLSPLVHSYVDEIQCFLESNLLYQYGLTNSQVLNLYPYCLNNPINATDPYGLFIGTLMKPIDRLFGTGAQEAHIASRVGNVMTSAGITAGAIPDPGEKVVGYIPGGKTTIETTFGSAQIWGGGQIIALGSGLVLTGGVLHPLAVLL